MMGYVLTAFLLATSGLYFLALDQMCIRDSPSAVPKNNSAAPSRKFFLENRISKILLCKLFLVSKGLL